MARGFFIKESLRLCRKAANPPPFNKGGIILSASASAKAVHAHHRRAAIAAVAGACVALGLGVSFRRRTVLLLISHALISRSIFLVAGFHLICPLEASRSFAEPAPSIIYTSFKKIPFSISAIFRNAIKKFVRFRNAVLLNKSSNVGKLAVCGISGSIAVIACVAGAVSSVTVTAGTSVGSSSGFAVFLNLFISGVDFHHLFCRNIRQGVINIFIRMIFSNKLAISFFNFFVGGAFRNAKNSVRIIRFVLPLSY